MVSSDRLVGASTTVPRPPAAYSGITAGMGQHTHSGM